MKKKFQENKQPLSILLLLTAVATILSIFLLRYYSIERAACVLRLREYTQQMGQQIQDSANLSKNYMNRVSGIIYDAYQESEEAGQYQLSALGVMDMVTRLELLMPDDTLYTPTGPVHDPSLSFGELSKMGSGILPRGGDTRSDNRDVVRIFTPVRREGETVAILCGVVDLERLDLLFHTSAYDGQTQLHLLESRTGNLLIDPWNSGRQGRLEDFSTWNYSGGNSYQQFQDEVTSGHGGSTVLRNPDTGKRYYMYYSPVGVQDWMVMLAVENHVAFAQANSISFLFGFMVILLVALSAFFFAWFLRDVRQQQKRTDLRLQGARYMQSVQETLFRAHIQPQRFRDALGEVAEYLAADATMFFALEDDGRLIMRSYSGASDKAPPKHSDFFQLFPQTAHTVLKEGSFASNRPFLWGDEDWQSARSMGMRNMMLVRLRTMDGEGTLGVLGAVNTDAIWDDTTPLDQVAFSFSMALANSKNYQILSYMSQMDELTGVLNRNSYETRLAELEAGTVKRLGCIYIDANGLHEINNHLGHDAGDEMLRAVADTLRSNFDKQDVFRLGGDEFAVLDRTMSQPEMEAKVEKIRRTVEKIGYSVSIGLVWQEGEINVPALIADAEARMRQDKAEYYANKGGERQMRNLTSRMEKTLAAKRDADSLLSYLAPDFLGVYFVNPKQDSYRTMVPSDHLKGIEGVKDTFQETITDYIRDWACPEDQKAFLALCPYEALLPMMEQKGSVEFIYTRIDGKRIRLQVRRPTRAGDNQDEIMWIFTDADHKR